MGHVSATFRIGPSDTPRQQRHAIDARVRSNPNGYLRRGERLRGPRLEGRSGQSGHLVWPLTSRLRVRVRPGEPDTSATESGAPSV